MYIYRIEKTAPVRDSQGGNGSIGYESRKKKSKVSVNPNGFHHIYDSAIEADSLNSQSAVDVFNGILNL
jgi:hypothetical protein